MRRIQQALKRNYFWLLGFIFGLLVFIQIYGIEPLRVTGDAWIYSGYIENDIAQHYTGWMFFRNSEWTFPLGKALNLGYPEGTNIAYTDSIPIVSIFFKIFRHFLPQTFQFFGLYIFLCFGFQGLMSSILVYEFTHDRAYACISSLIFLFSSCMIDRAFRHTALASHWLILAALCLYFWQEYDNKKSSFFWFLILNCITLGTHPYLFMMVLPIFIAKEICVLHNNKKWKRFIYAILINAAGTLGFGWITGLFGSEKLSPDKGFGAYSLNLNGIINPTARHISKWSLFMPQLPQLSTQNDGIYYLGLGILLGMILSILLFIIRISRARFEKKLLSKEKADDHFTLNFMIILAVLYTLFAISNVVTWGNHVLLRIPVSDTLLKYINIFRSSGRFFFMPTYLIYLFTVVSIYQIGKNKLRMALILILTIIQAVDISPVLKTKHDYFSVRRTYSHEFDGWEKTADYDSMVVFEPIRRTALDYWIAKNGMKTNAMFSAPIHYYAYYERTTEDRKKIFETLNTGNELNADTVYVFTDSFDFYFTSQSDFDSFLHKVKQNYRGKAEINRLKLADKYYWVLMPDR